MIWKKAHINIIKWETDPRFWKMWSYKVADFDRTPVGILEETQFFGIGPRLPVLLVKPLGQYPNIF